MTIKVFHNQVVQLLQTIYPEYEGREMAYRLFDFYLHRSKVDIALDPNLNVENQDFEQVEQALSRLLKKEPLQYVLGETEFYDLHLSVNSNVLIPRPETEELVDLILQRHSGNVSLLDIGTGSGCIPIAIKKNNAMAQVSACDISDLALEVAQQNAIRNDVSIAFFQCDILDMENLPQGKYDVIVSNPPYVLNSEKALLRDNVLDYEPGLALFVEDETPLLFYEAIADFGLQSLNDTGYLYFEINEGFGAETKAMLEKKGYRQVEIHADIFAKQRMVSAILAP